MLDMTHGLGMKVMVTLKREISFRSTDFDFLLTGSSNYTQVRILYLIFKTLKHRKHSFKINNFAIVNFCSILLLNHIFSLPKHDELFSL